MKRFKFRLEAVLDQRSRVEKQAKSSFAEAQQALIRAQKLLVELEEVRVAILDELAQRRLSGDFCPSESQMYQEYLTTIKAALREHAEYVRDLQGTAEAFRLHLIGASRNRQIVDKLKERDHESHVASFNRAEQAAADELASVRHQFARHAKPTMDG